MKISCEKGLVDEKEVERLEVLLKFFDLPVRVKGLEKEEIYDTLFKDKKVRDNKIGFVLIEKIGTPLRTKALSEDEIKKGIEYIVEVGE